MTGFRNILFILTLLCVSESFAQEAVHKVSKTIARDFTQDVEQIIVMGEKASVEVKGWDNNYISVVMRPVSRNASKVKAISDLKIVTFSAGMEGKKLVIRNSFKGGNEKISSNLSMEFEIRVPEATPVKITNLYGPVQAEGLSALETDVSYGHISLTAISGHTSIRSRYSNIDIKGASGSVSISAEKSDIVAEALAASTHITCRYGIVLLGLSSADHPLVINGSRTAATVSVEDYTAYNYRLSTTYGTIVFPGQDRVKGEKLELQLKEENSTIEIHTSYSDIIIQSKSESHETVQAE